jgi:hypothetical protein
MHPSGSMVKVALPQTVLGASFVRVRSPLGG